MRPSPPLYSRPAHGLLVLQEDEPSEDDEAENSSRREDAHWPLAGTSRGRRHSAYPEAREWRSPTRPSCQTNNGVLVVCLNIGVDPPGLDRRANRGRMECWYEPDLTASHKSANVIKERLQAQYRRWHPLGKFKAITDPTIVELQRMTRAARRHAKDERVLFHYNGHGVPAPTPTGEIWMFNSNFTKYLPFNLSELHSLVGNPSLYIFDLDHAGFLVNFFRPQPLNGHDAEQYPGQSAHHGLFNRTDDDPFPEEDCIVLGSCGENERLPTDPNLPADLFTSCLTTPIRTALIFYASRSLITGITPEMIDKMPGDMEKRNTPLGDLARIFTTISDTIAWNILPPALFRRLFRQDLLLASMMRNFLLACRIMSFYECTPVSIPALPAAHNHSLWESLEYTMEQYLAQVPSNFRMQRAAQAEHEYRERWDTPVDTIEGINKAALFREESLRSGYLSSFSRYRVPLQPGHGRTSGPVLTHNLTYEPSTFFEDQIKAFEVWLDMGSEDAFPPEQLPILLLLLIQGHYRKQGLRLLSRFLQIGRKAVDLALSIGVFPYMLQYLSKPSAELMPYLVLIWGKILAYDPKCHSDLAKIGAHRQFVQFLAPPAEPSGVHLAVGFFIVSVFGSHPDLAYECRAHGILKICQHRMSHQDPLVRRWACLCMTQILCNCKFEISAKAPELMHYAESIAKSALRDEVADVRAAGVSAIAEVLYHALQQVRIKAEREERRMPVMIGGSSVFAADYAAHSGRTSLDSNHAMRSSTVATGTLTDAAAGQRSEVLRESIFVPNEHKRGLNSHDRNAPVSTFESVNFATNEQKRSPNNRIRRAPVGRFVRSPEPPAVEAEIVNFVGSILAKMGLDHSSVLVRREVAIALARAAQFHRHPFVNAAQQRSTNEWRAEIRNGNLSGSCPGMTCYAEMWATLLELAFDPHPVVASHARKSFDMISACISVNFSDDGEAQNKPAESLASHFNNPILPQSYESTRSQSSSVAGDHGSAPAVIHIRGSSGRIDLNTLVPHAPGRIPRVNSASLINLNELESLTPNPMGSHFPRFLNDESEGSFESPPKSRLIAGVSNLFRTFPFGQPTGPANNVQRSVSGNGFRSRESSLSNIDRFASPRRPHRRSRSYQVIAPWEISSSTDGTQHPNTHHRVPVEKAVDSLHSWSSACMSRVAFDSNGPDHMPVPDPIPQYTKLWDSILNPKDDVDGSRAFTLPMKLIAEGVAPEAKDCSLSNFSERKTFRMGAGGGAVISMAFLPQEVGREGDQYIVTGDSTGSVGVYDALDGQCQSSFGIPGPPGIPDVDVTSVMCLTDCDADRGGLSIAQQTPLILAGSYDGRVAVFRSDLVSKKYSVLSAFQASGGSLWANLRREQFGETCPILADRSRSGILDSSRGENSGRGARVGGMGLLLKSSGNGLVLGFRNYESTLFAAGCEYNLMKVWDLAQEKCSWKGKVAGRGIWPTAISVPPWDWCNNMVVVGASDGSISLIDTRVAMTNVAQTRILGKHKHPIVSTAHGLWVGEGRGETIVSADCEGEIILWDPRRSEGSLSGSEADRSHVRAHERCLTTMAAHPSGNFIASGSTAKCVKVFGANTSEKDHVMIRSRQNRFRMSERIAPVTSLAFHQQDYILAVGCSDSTVTMYGNG